MPAIDPARRRAPTRLLAAIAAGLGLAACTTPPTQHVSLAPGAPDSARLTVEMMDPPPFDAARGETNQSFFASFYRKDACRPETTLLSVSRQNDKGAWVSRDETSTTGRRPGGAPDLEFREAARLEVGIAAGAPVRLSMIGIRQFSRTNGVTITSTTVSCPGAVQFTPASGAVYVARHVWITGRCGVLLSQATGEGAERRSVPVPATPICPQGVDRS